jgi:hypothetical protein
MTTFASSSTYSGVYVVFMVNRLQILFSILILPMYLVHSYMIWGIVAIGILSQLNLLILSKWFSSDFAAKGYNGFVELFGERTVRLFVIAGLFPILLNIVVNTLGYVQMVHTFIFPSMDNKWLILSIFLVGCYVAAKGMANTIRFVMIAFLSGAWIILLFLPLFFPPEASLYDLYPLVPTDWSIGPWKSWLALWSSFSGPEYLICLTTWLSPQQKIRKYLTLANAITVFEYVYLFVASLLFFGPHYLNAINFPVVHMGRYLQSPVIERIDTILLSIHMFNYVFAIAILLLCFYGAVRIILGRLHKQTTRTGYVSACLVILICMFIVDKWFWNATARENFWVTLQMWLGAFTYSLIPVFLLLAIKRKGAV